MSSIGKLSNSKRSLHPAHSAEARKKAGATIRRKNAAGLRAPREKDREATEKQQKYGNELWEQFLARERAAGRVPFADAADETLEEFFYTTLEDQASAMFRWVRAQRARQEELRIRWEALREELRRKEEARYRAHPYGALFHEWHKLPKREGLKTAFLHGTELTQFDFEYVPRSSVLGNIYGGSCPDDMQLYAMLRQGYEEARDRRAADEQEWRSL